MKVSYKCLLKAGAYLYRAQATDVAGNKLTNVATAKTKKLTVK